METSYWIIFNVVVISLLLIDLMVFNRKSHEVKISEALKWTAFWIFVALAFNVLVYFWKGPSAAIEFLTGYLIEKSLSVDNLFVFLMVFTFFNVPAKYQHKILFWGIFGALIFRAIFIFAGVALIENFHFTIYILGAFLIFGGIKMMLHKEDEQISFDPNVHPVVAYAKKFLPISDTSFKGKFFLIRKKKFLFTPLFIVLLVIETTDIIFAMDSIPAILAISKDSFVVYTSNIFALLGLRALYFALAGLMNSFHYLKQGLSVILSFVGLKIMVSAFYKIDVVIALVFIASVLLISILASIYFPPKKPAENPFVELAKNNNEENKEEEKEPLIHS
jgi:tellurite resistance protein TerC